MSALCSTHSQPGSAPSCYWSGESLPGVLYIWRVTIPRLCCNCGSTWPDGCCSKKKKKKDPCTVDHPRHFVMLCCLVSFNSILTAAEATLSRLFWAHIVLCRPRLRRISALTSERLTMTSFFPSVHSLLLIYHSESMLPSNHMTTCALCRLPPTLVRLHPSVSGNFLATQWHLLCCCVIMQHDSILLFNQKRQKGAHWSNITV